MRNKRLLVAFWILSKLVSPLFSIVCAEISGPNLDKVGKCNGDRCYHNRLRGVFDFEYVKGCISGYQLDNGCWSIGREESLRLTMCICDTDNCNSENMTSLGTVMPQIECKYEFLSKETTELDYIDQTSQQDVCLYRGSLDFESGQNIKEKTGINAPTQAVLPLPDFSVGSIGFFYLNGIYVYQRENDTIRFYSKCDQTLCTTDMTIDDIPRTGVKCKLSDNTTCDGQFCVLQILYSVTDYLCLWKNERKSKYKLTVGEYRMDGLEVYICQEEFCNEYLEKAKKSIKNWVPVVAEVYDDDLAQIFNLINVVMLIAIINL